jgi:hypothetical protein
MAVKGKRKYSFYLDENNVEFLKAHFVARKDEGGLSGFLDKYLERTVWMLKSNPDVFEKIKPGKLTFPKLWQLVKLQWRNMEEHENCKVEKNIEVEKHQ